MKSCDVYFALFYMLFDDGPAPLAAAELHMLSGKPMFNSNFGIWTMLSAFLLNG